jgi:hypothetical protein
MKTTVDIADALLKQAKRLAAKRGMTLRELIESGLRHELERQRAVDEERAELRTHTFRGRGLQRGVVWGDWGTLRDLAYEGRGS